MKLIGTKTYKACLEITLIEESKVLIELLYIDDTAISSSNVYDISVHRNKKHNFCIWSSQHFCLSYNYLRFPNHKNISGTILYDYDYDTDDKRKKGLKKLYDSLQTWACDKKVFINNYSSNKISNIDIYDNYWFIY